MKTALGLTTLSIVLAAVVAYGTHPAWAQYPHGLSVILWSRQFQWPALFLSLGAALAIVALVAAGKQRAWWLLGLAPILALFVHRFATDPAAGMAAVEDPAFVPAAQATFVADDDFVVGLRFGDKSYAYPYAALYATPAVIHAQHDQRILVLWSPTANRAIATTIKRDLRARHLDIVSTPANALLVYDTARGQFFNGLTGRTIDGAKPPAFGSPIPTAKTTWRQWRAGHPETTVMVPTGALAARAPRQPLLPSFPLPKGVSSPERPLDLPVVVVGSTEPVAIAAHELHGAPVNLTADGAPVMAFRDPRTRGVRAFARRLDDLCPRFKLNLDISKAAKGAHLVDLDTETAWTADGVAVDAKKEFRGKRLAPAVAEDGLYWGVMKFWYPKLELASVEPPPPPVARAQPGPATAPSRAVARKNRNQRTSRAARPQANPRADAR